MYRLFKGLVAVLALSLIASCGSSADSDESSGERVNGGELKIAFPTTESFDINSLDPNVGGGKIYAHTVNMSMYDMLVYQDPDSGDVVPGIAKEWEISKDGREYTFKLRDDVKFWDGEPLTADDVKFTMDRVVDPKYQPTSAYAAASVSGLDSVKVVDKHTVKMKLKKPRVEFLANLGKDFIAIVPKHYIEKVGDKEFGKKPLGSGPFKFVEWERDDHITVERNEDYSWGPEFTETSGKPASLDKITFVYIAEDSTRIAALQSDQVNAIVGIPPTSQAMLEKDDAFDIVEIQKNGQPGGLVFDTQSPGPTGDVDVRRAIAYAVDRDAINDSVYQGVHKPAYHLLEERMGKWVNPDAKFPEFDPDEARAILDKAGWTASGEGEIREKDGKKLTFKATTSTSVEKAMTLIKSQLKDVGIDLVVDVVSPAEASSVYQSEGHYALAWGNPLGWTSGMPDLLYSLYDSGNIPPNGTSNESKTDIPEVDKLLQSAIATNDDDARKKAFYEVQKIVTDYVSYLPLLSFNANVAVAKGIHGIVPERRGTYIYFHDVWMDKSVQ